jgi:hypothetical protein
MPEEINRIVADRVSDYLFAPSADAVSNLRAEGYRADQVHLVGNVMVDTLLANLDRARGPACCRGWGSSRRVRAGDAAPPGERGRSRGAGARCWTALGELAAPARWCCPPTRGRRAAAPPRDPRGVQVIRRPATSTSSRCRRRPGWC